MSSGLWMLLVVGLGWWSYAPHLYDPPDEFDERQYVLMMAPLTPHDLGRWCTTPYETFPYFRPLGFLSMYVDRLLWNRPSLRYLPDGRPDRSDLERQTRDPYVAFPYRLGNLMVYIAGCIAFGLMLGRMGRSRLLAAIGGAVYALAPHNRLTALYYPERFILLVALFWFSSAYCYLGRFEGPTALRSRGVWSVILFALSLGAKEHAVILPVLLAAWTAVLKPRDQWLRAVAPLVGMVAVLGVYLLVRYEVRGYFYRDDMLATGALPRFWKLPLRFMAEPLVGIAQGVLVLWPLPWSLLTFGAWRGLLSVAAFVGSAWLLVGRQWRLLACFLLWLPIVYAPVLHAYAFDMLRFKLHLPGAAMPALTAVSLWQWIVLAREWGWPARAALGLAIVIMMSTWVPT